jgi:MFS family permease
MLIFPAVLLLLKEEFGMGYLGMGVIGNIMIFSYGLGSLPGGLIYNRLGPKKLYLFCFLGSAGACLLVAASSNLILFTAGLALLGVLGSVYHPMVNSLITSKVKEYGKALGIHGATGNIGLASAPFIAGLIASRWGWRQAYLFFMAPGVALSIWALFVDMSIKREAQRERSPAHANPASASLVEKFWIFFSLPLILIYMLNYLQSFGSNGAITFLPTYMAKYTSFHILSWDSVAIGGMLSGLALLMGVFGQYTGGLLAEKPRLERNLVVMAAICFPSLLAMAFIKDIPLLIMSLIFFFFTFSLQPMMNVLLAQRTTPEMRGTAYGIFFFAAFGLGSLSSSFSGYIAQRFGLPWVFLGLSGSVLVLILFTFVYLRIKEPRS